MPSIRKISPGQVDAKPQTNSSLNAEPAEEDLGVCGKTIAYIILLLNYQKIIRILLCI
jgi:hypothetical protein